MKKNKNIFMASVLLLSLGLASCTDSFLDVTSKTESSTGTFYKTEKDAYRALIGCYDGWRQTSSAMMVGFYMASEVMSAECFGDINSRKQKTNRNHSHRTDKIFS